MAWARLDVSSSPSNEGRYSDPAQLGTLFCTSALAHSMISWAQVVLRKCKVWQRFYGFHWSGLGVSFGSIVNKCLGTAARRHVAALEFVTLVLVRFLNASKQSAVGFQCNDSKIGQDVAWFSSILPLTCVGELTSTALHPSSSFAFSAQLPSVFRIVAQQKYINCLLIVCHIRARTALPTVVRTSWLTWLCRQGDGMKTDR